jgi:hypothetical protein
MTLRTIPAALVLAAALASCGGAGPSAADAYREYVSNAPAGEPVLSAEDAEARALAACFVVDGFEPGSTDAALIAAYGCP